MSLSKLLIERFQNLIMLVVSNQAIRGSFDIELENGEFIRVSVESFEELPRRVKKTKKKKTRK